MKKILYLLLILLLFTSISSGQENSKTYIEQLCSDLQEQLAIRLDNWKYSTQMTPDAWEPKFNDSNWDTLQLNQVIHPDSAWMRRTITLPNSILGEAVKVGVVKLCVTVDDAGICWINGENKGLFKWDGEFILTENPKPGQKFHIAIKAINTGGPMRIINAKLKWDMLDQLLEKVQNYVMSLKVGQKLLSDDTYIKIGRVQTDNGIDQSNISKEERLELRKQLDQAARIVDIKALEKGNLKRFKESLDKSIIALKPIDDFANKFTFIFDSNAHIDCAWLWRYLETINVAKNTFSSVLDMMEARPDFTYTQSQAHLFWWIETKFPKLFDKIKKRVKDGRWEMVGGMWVEPDCNLISGESWARQLLYGKRYFKEKFGVDIKIGWNPDSFGYNWNMPQFYRDAGIDAFITQKIGWNDTNMFPYRLFWWQSPDGTKLLTYFPYNYVNTVKDPFVLVDWMRQFDANTGFEKLLVLYGVGDHGGGPDLPMIDRIEELRNLYIYPAVEYGTATEYLNWIRSFDLSSLPVWNDELYLEYHRGTYTTQANTKKANRECEILFTNTEQISTFANLYGRPYNNKNLFKGWRGVLFNQFHDILPGSSIYPVYKDSDELYEQSRKIADHEINGAISYLAKKINTKVGKNAKPVMIYNSLAWNRTDIVELLLPEDDKQFYSVYDDTGKELSSQIISAGLFQNKILFVAKDIPAMGYAVYHLKIKGF